MTTAMIQGCKVSAKVTKHGLYATSYANRTQAEKAVANLAREGVEAFVLQVGRCFYARIVD